MNSSPPFQPYFSGASSLREGEGELNGNMKCLYKIVPLIRTHTHTHDVRARARIHTHMYIYTNPPTLVALPLPMDVWAAYINKKKEPPMSTFPPSRFSYSPGKEPQP